MVAVSFSIEAFKHSLYVEDQYIQVMKELPTILVTGGAGYIGSHTCVTLLEEGYRVVVLDNFSNSHPLAMERVRQLSPPGLEVVRGDVRDTPLVTRILREQGCQTVIHFAGLKVVAESVE